MKKLILLCIISLLFLSCRKCVECTKTVTRYNYPYGNSAPSITHYKSCDGSYKGTEGTHIEEKGIVGSGNTWTEKTTIFCN